jgi:hypothetical protein
VIPTYLAIPVVTVGVWVAAVVPPLAAVARASPAVALAASAAWLLSLLTIVRRSPRPPAALVLSLVVLIAAPFASQPVAQRTGWSPQSAQLAVVLGGMLFIAVTAELAARRLARAQPSAAT